MCQPLKKKPLNLNKELIVSATIRTLVGTLRSIGDVNDIFARRGAQCLLQF